VSAKLAIFCGKGGVGKTTLSFAAGLKSAIAGHKVLIVSSHPLAELALALSLEGLAERFPAAASNLFVLYIDPQELINEFVKRHLPGAIIGQRVLHSSVFENLVEIAPGLKEFFFLWRLQELAERRATGSPFPVPAYDFLIWDAPASGHFLSMLRGARNFGGLLTGALAEAEARTNRFFTGSRNIRLFPVTSLEEMAIVETLEVAQTMASDFAVPCSALLVNCASPMCTAGEDDIKAIREPAAVSPALRFAVQRGLIERQRLRDLSAALPAPQVLIPRMTRCSSDLDLIARIGEQMDLARFS
jgi:anion-transporting  ArsA/GET3 family ATPase